MKYTPVFALTTESVVRSCCYFDADKLEVRRHSDIYIYIVTQVPLYYTVKTVASLLDENNIDPTLKRTDLRWLSELINENETEEILLTFEE